MPKLYAVINPAFTYEGNYVDLTAPLVNLYHYLSYENIGGYSLGSQVTFFHSLDEAKNYVAPQQGTLNQDLLKARSQSAVIEFDEDEHGISGFGNIYTVSKIEEAYGDTEYGRIEKVWKPVWQECELDLCDISDHADTELLKKLQFERHMRTHSLDYLKATMISTDETDRINGDFLKSLLSILATTAGLAVSERIPVLGFPIAVAGCCSTYYHINDSIKTYNNIAERRSDYLNNNVFTPRNHKSDNVDPEHRVSCAMK